MTLVFRRIGDRAATGLRAGAGGVTPLRPRASSPGPRRGRRRRSHHRPQLQPGGDRTATPAGAWDGPPAIPGQVAVVTGATSGIGLATATALAALGATVHLVGRNAERAREAAAMVESAGPGTVHIDLVDMADLDAVAAFAAGLTERYEKLDVLVHNAGALSRTYRTTPAGTEQTVATQVLGPYVLTATLAPLLCAALAGHGGDGQLGRHVHPTLRPRAPGDGAGGLRRGGGLRPGQTGAGGAGRGLGRTIGPGGGGQLRHAPGMGGHSGSRGRPPPLPPGVATVAADPGRRGRHGGVVGRRWPPGGGRRPVPRPSRPASSTTGGGDRNAAFRCSTPPTRATARPCWPGVPAAPASSPRSPPAGGRETGRPVGDVVPARSENLPTCPPCGRRPGPVPSCLCSWSTPPFSVRRDPTADASWPVPCGSSTGRWAGPSSSGGATRAWSSRRWRRRWGR